MKRRRPVAPREFIRRLAGEQNELKRKLLLVGYLSDRLARNKGTIFLVGGQAVETYTGGVFTTGDIDITTTDTQATEVLLLKLGFDKEGIVWVSPRLGMGVHLVASYPRRSLRARTIGVDGYSVRIVGVEDLVVDRLSAAKFWKSERDFEQARALLNTFRDSIDYGYLKAVAREEKVGDYLRRARKRSSRRRRHRT
jgi:hypothetical protein